MDILIWSLVFIASLAVLIKAADFFTDSAEKIGLHFKISPFIIGVTIVAFGTSLPEIATSIAAVLKNDSSMVIANVAGSNIANILLVLGASAIVGKHLVVDKDIINIDLPLLLGSAILLFITTVDGVFSAGDGVITLLALLTYVLYNIMSHRKIDQKETSDIKQAAKELKAAKKNKPQLPLRHPIILILSGIGIWIAADYTIEAVLKLSEIINIGTEVIAGSAIALGTSLPELIVSVMAAKKGKTDIAIGNVTGSNIFNALAVMGIPSMIGPLAISTDMITFVIPFTVLTTILYMFVTMDKQVSQWEGITLVLLYVAFIGKLLGFL